MWATRNEDGSLWLNYKKPEKVCVDKYWGMWSTYEDSMELLPKLLPEVKWEDEEPTEVEIVIKNK